MTEHHGFVVGPTADLLDTIVKHAAMHSEFARSHGYRIARGADRCSSTSGGSGKDITPQGPWLHRLLAQSCRRSSFVKLGTMHPRHGNSKNTRGFHFRSAEHGIF